MSKPRILLVDDDHEFLRRFLLLGEEHFELKTAIDGSSALRAVAEDPPDAVLLDVDLGKGLSGIEVLVRLRQEARDIPVIMVSGDETPSTIVAAIRAGASDYISKRPNLELLRVKIEAALRDVAWRVHARSMQRSAMSSLVGSSAAMLALREEIVRASRLKIRVLIAGESGTGKELVARALHEESPRRDEKFVVLSGAEGTDELFDSKLFGYEKGAFTGAASRRIGRYELADRGTLFIDEIGKMPLVQQAKLLRVIESGSFERMGGLDTLEKDTRVICASNEDLEAKVASGAFLDDLLYRIQEYRIDVPPLRKRLEDLPELADALIKRFARLQGLEDTALVQGALDPLYDYEWPGNVRELESILKVATLYSKDGVITEDAIATSLRQHRRRRGSRPSLAEETGDRVRLENVRETRKDAGERTLAEFAHGPYTEARESVLEAFDRLFVLRALASAGGNCAAATRAMGLSRSTFYRLLGRLGIDVERD